MEEQQVNLSEIKGIESEGIDLEKWHKKNVVIENIEVTQVPSTFTPKDEKGEHLQQWVLKVSSKVLETIGESEDKIEFRASELFNLIQDKNGKLIGFPKNERAKIVKFCKDLKISIDKIEDLQQLVDEIKDKSATIKAYEKEFEIDGKTFARTYLKFLY